MMMRLILTPLLMVLLIIHRAEVSKVKTIWSTVDYMDGYDASADNFVHALKRITKKDMTASQLNKANEDYEQNLTLNTMKGLEHSLSFPFVLLRRKYMEGILRNMNRQKINYQNMEHLPDLETYG
jgi:hypothetical protein